MPVIRVDIDTWNQLKRLATHNRRSIVEELRISVEARMAGIVSQPNASVTVEEAEGLMETLGEEEDRASNPTLQADIQLLVDRLIMHEEEVLNAE